MRKLILIVVFFVSLIDSLFAQKRHITQKSTDIDTLNLFYPIGCIYAPLNGKVVPSDSLTKQFQNEYIRFSSETAPFKVTHIGVENSFKDSTLQYLTNLMFRMENISFESFENNRLSQPIIQALRPFSGRFFGLICFSGYEQKNNIARVFGSFVETQIIGSAIISNGNFWERPIPTNPMINTYFAIFDKKNECVLFYHLLQNYGSPTDESNIKAFCEKYYKILNRK